jgi:hypothetical protein
MRLLLPPTRITAVTRSFGDISVQYKLPKAFNQREFDRKGDAFSYPHVKLFDGATPIKKDMPERIQLKLGIAIEEIDDGCAPKL